MITYRLALSAALLVGAAPASTSAAMAAQQQQPAGPVVPVPPQFVVSPEAGRRVHDHISINAATAERLSHVCEEKAAAAGGSATIVILDPFGLVVHQHRMDGQSYINIKAAEQKARTALLTRAPSHVLTNRAFDDVQVTIRMEQFGLTVQTGGLPIIVNDQIIGAIGVGGGAGYGEEECARDALEAVFGPQPALLPVLGAGGGGGIPARLPAGGGAAGRGGRGGAPAN
jgi:glc operon protein GlcG